MIADGAKRVILVVPGWLSYWELRYHVMRQAYRAVVSLQAPPVHIRWAWLRENEDGQQQTAFLIWTCTSTHPPNFQCMNGRIAYGNVPFSGRPLIPAPAP
jgi:hypothetical protein